MRRSIWLTSSARPGDPWRYNYRGDRVDVDAKGSGCQPAGGVGGQLSVDERNTGDQHPGVLGKVDRDRAEIHDTGELGLSAEREYIRSTVGEPVHLTLAECGKLTAHPEHPPVEFEHRVRVVPLRLDGVLAPTGRLR